ncbi:hypothetical protein V8G54_018951 [Vigna mungo]|uniref:Uncharacterized protein n=1 Tax=Vigna mungo TaxID=3915 RepID=A0AAQ3NAS0_VIGMU
MKCHVPGKLRQMIITFLILYYNSCDFHNLCILIFPPYLAKVLLFFYKSHILLVLPPQLTTNINLNIIKTHSSIHIVKRREPLKTKIKTFSPILLPYFFFLHFLSFFFSFLFFFFFLLLFLL